ncbi:VOC family protein [Amphritea pacifica]|uniref:Drug:proton antiporter n=1 Tax=Amphritea pacifica TaxID=2811233 RepID=A0ABS2WAD8_9GAMM|nr:VOC family protein [Amphritea pacifica]MBN0988679.1 drug:proton antiporter [Amphritea pacifica]
MPDSNFIILYVENPSHSVEFYSTLLEKSPVENSPNFALFVLDSGMKFGLWQKQDVQPAVETLGISGEIAFPLPDKAEVSRIYHRWQDRGLTMIQEPTAMEFGYTFVSLDPDGNRLRVFSPAES